MLRSKPKSTQTSMCCCQRKYDHRLDAKLFVKLHDSHEASLFCRGGDNHRFLIVVHPPCDRVFGAQIRRKNQPRPIVNLQDPHLNLVEHFIVKKETDELEVPRMFQFPGEGAE